jgi:hypothetical protein
MERLSPGRLGSHLATDLGLGYTRLIRQGNRFKFDSPSNFFLLA